MVRTTTIVRMEKNLTRACKYCFFRRKGTEQLNVSPGEQKVLEYVDRIKSGEALSAILDGLPESFALGIEEGTARRYQNPGSYYFELDDRATLLNCWPKSQSMKRLQVLLKRILLSCQ